MNNEDTHNNSEFVSDEVVDKDDITDDLSDEENRSEAGSELGVEDNQPEYKTDWDQEVDRYFVSEDYVEKDDSRIRGIFEKQAKYFYVSSVSNDTNYKVIMEYVKKIESELSVQLSELDINLIMANALFNLDGVDHFADRNTWYKTIKVVLQPLLSQISESRYKDIERIVNIENVQYPKMVKGLEKANQSDIQKLGHLFNIFSVLVTIPIRTKITEFIPVSPMKKSYTNSSASVRSYKPMPPKRRYVKLGSVVVNKNVAETLPNPYDIDTGVNWLLLIDPDAIQYKDKSMETYNRLNETFRNVVRSSIRTSIEKQLDIERDKLFSRGLQFNEINKELVKLKDRMLKEMFEMTLKSVSARDELSDMLSNLSI